MFVRHQTKPLGFVPRKVRSGGSDNPKALEMMMKEDETEELSEASKAAIKVFLMNAALRYAAQGLFVFPCQPGGKSPITAHGADEATTNPLQIRAWWTQNPYANIGCVPSRSGHVVIDLDAHETYLTPG